MNSSVACLYRYGLLSVMLWVCPCASLHAHNVVAGAYAEGMTIEGEIGFSNGEMAQAGSLVKVYDSNNKLLAELSLAEGGVFLYEAKQVSRHLFKADLSAGHVAEIIIEADELSPPRSVLASVAKRKPAPKLTAMSTGEAVSHPSPDASGALLSALAISTAKQGDEALAPVDQDINNVRLEQLEGMIRRAVAQQVRPLQKELRAYKEKVMFRDIAGGLGFIFGLFGVAAWAVAKRKPRDDNATVS